MAMNSPTTTANTLRSPARRNAIQRMLCLAGVLAGAPVVFRRHAQAAGVEQQRFALVVGNGDYPAPHDLPPIHKNVMDLGEALTFRGFDVTHAMNLNMAGLQVAVTDFVKRVAAAPSDSVTLFYYAGHGLQVNSNNLLLGAGANPTAPRQDLLSRSLVLQHKLLSALPARPQALNITVIDACRTDLRHALGDEEGLSQMEAPLGSMVCFSTGAGRPAVSPASAEHNTFYTASLVRLLLEAGDHITFNDLFRMVKSDVEQIMLNHPLAAIRKLAQSPFIADNTRVQVALLRNSGKHQGMGQGSLDPQEESAWQLIQNSQWPVDLIKYCREFLEKYPKSLRVQSVALYQAGAIDALNVLRSKDVKLFKTSFVVPDDKVGAGNQQELSRAARGDKDAAARIARLHRELNTEQGLSRYIGWLQYASGLGNGIASYELALFYRENAQPLLAAQAEARAKQLGYSPPRTLGHERK